MEKLTLAEWLTATTEQRGEWLLNDRQLDNQSHIILGWALAFRDNGGHVSDETMLKVYNAQIESYKAA